MDLIYKIITLNKIYLFGEKIKCLHDDIKMLILYLAYICTIRKTSHLWKVFSLGELAF